jgi:hypothetical protein
MKQNHNNSNTLFNNNMNINNTFMKPFESLYASLAGTTNNNNNMIDIAGAISALNSQQQSQYQQHQLQQYHLQQQSE